jgi:hypothetical protein
MSRLYVIESAPVGTGSLADHRIAAAPTRVTAMAVLVAREVLGGRPVGGPGLRAALNGIDIGEPTSDETTAAKVIADDLIAHANASAGSAVMIAGPTQPAAVHALVAAVNEALGAVGGTVEHREIDPSRRR